MPMESHSIIPKGRGGAMPIPKDNKTSPEQHLILQ